MVKRNSTTILSLLTLALFLSGCVKTYPGMETEDITGTWAVTSIRSDRSFDWDGDGRSETDIFGTYSTCQRDIILVFDYNGSGSSRQGCHAQWQNLNWDLYNRTLHISMYGDELNLENVQLSSHTIRGTDRVYMDGRNFEITYTLSRR